MDTQADGLVHCFFQLNYRLCTLFPVVAQRDVDQSPMAPSPGGYRTTFAAHLDVLSLCGIRSLLPATVHHIYTATKRPISEAGARETHAPHLLHTNKYATLWDNPGVIMMINCQVI